MKAIKLITVLIMIGVLSLVLVGCFTDVSGAEDIYVKNVYASDNATHNIGTANETFNIGYFQELWVSGNMSIHCFDGSTISGGSSGSGAWLTGAGVPEDLDGVDGDLYLNTTTADVYQKLSGSWDSPVANIKGVQGIQGTNGATGSPGANGEDGQGFTSRGEWTNGEAYNTYDIVTHAPSGSTYECYLTADPSSISPATDTTHFRLWAAKGATGNPGTAGAAGPNTVSTSTTTNITGILKGNGSTILAATSGTDYISPSTLWYPPCGSLQQLGNFESGTAGWGDGSGATLSQSTTQHKVGDHSLKYLVTAASNWTYGNFNCATTPNWEGITIYGGAWCFAPSTNRGTMFLFVAGDLTTNNWTTSAVPKDDTWHWISGTFLMPNNATAPRMAIVGGEVDDILYVDGAVLLTNYAIP